MNSIGFIEHILFQCRVSGFLKYMISIQNISKVYDQNLKALEEISLEIEPGEIFALLGPNGAGKTTLISSICGLTRQTSGLIKVSGFDTLEDYKKTRSLIGLVPQEFPLENYESVIETVKFTRGLFGKSSNPSYIEKVLKSLRLWEKRSTPIIALSGGMKRRVLIAKALSHEPEILFLDEPTSGVDVQLRKEMWDLIIELKKRGVTVILTTHYIKEAEMIADRVGILNRGRLLLVEEKKELIKKFGKKTISVELKEKLHSIPEKIAEEKVYLSEDRHSIFFEVSNTKNKMSLSDTIKMIAETGLSINDINTTESSLEDIFLEIIAEEEMR